ncbi:MAG: fimbrial biogenesis outer membrane usher protein [Proteobacteria bacterium]|nr:fimbrial biogenesis outer membrane usher protein [Pseudomonadota bacterium]
MRALAAGLALALAAGLGPPPPAAAETADEIYERVFGKPPAQQARPVPVPLVVDGRDIGETRILIRGEPQRVLVSLAPFLAALEALLDADMVTAISAFADGDGRAAIADLNTTGLTVTYDPGQLILAVDIPAGLRRVLDLSLRSFPGPLDADEVLGPADLSAYVNLRAGLDYVHTSPAEGATGRQPLRLGLDGAVAAFGWVIEAEGSFREAAPRLFERGNLRLVHDDVENGLRTSIGDLPSATAGYQGFRPMAGVSVVRNFETEPYRSIHPSGQRRVVLTRPSTVEVLVNGRVVDTLRLGPGPVNLRDFPVANGVNDITLRITDDLGREETVAFPFFFDSGLLAPGLHEFGYSLGFPGTGEAGLFGYDTGAPTFSAFHRLGIDETTTLGANLQGDPDRVLLGAEGLHASAIGTFGLEAAVSHDRTGAVGGAITLGYRHVERDAGGSGYARNWDFSVIGTSRSFTTLGTDRSGNPVALDLSGRVSQPLPFGLSAGLGARYRFARDGRGDAYDVNLFLRKRFDRGPSLSLSVDHSRSPDGVGGLSAVVSLSIPFGEHRHALRSTYDTRDRTFQADWQYQPENQIGGLGAHLGLTRRSGASELTGGIEHRNGRLEVHLDHDVVSPRLGASAREQRTRLALASALVFADGHIAVSRPVADSFALVVPHPNLAGQVIGVEPSGDSYLAEVDWLGPAVVPNLASYEHNTLVIDAPGLPLGYDLGNDRPELVLPYRSGAVVHVGTDASVLLDGILQDADGAPRALQAGEVRTLDAPEREAIPFFTNRRGRFRVNGLRPGRYELSLFAEPKAVLGVEIPAQTEGLFNVGVLRF